jgi:hypothetical protein
MKRFDTLSPLKKWVISNKYFIKTTESKDQKLMATHYLLDGGIWKIPLNEYQTFLKLLADDLTAGEKHYISENKTEIFKFICDLDFYDETVITVKQVKHIVDVVYEVIKEYFGEHRIIVCGADSKQVTIDDQPLTKSGFHLVVPKLWVTTQTAKKLRIVLIKTLLETFGERASYNTWSDVVDLSIYEDNGLRMVGCRKIGFCKVCKNKRETRESCQACQGVGKIDENRVYRPVAVLPENEEFLSSINDYYAMLLETSIYNYSHFPETPLICDLGIELEETGKKARKTKKSSKTVDSGAQEDLQSKVQNFIRKNYKDHYSNCNVKNVTKVENKFYVEIDDNYCMNVNRNHNSSNVYFQISDTGICQRCYCKKETTEGRAHGCCRSYASKEMTLNPTLKRLLFGGQDLKSNKRLVEYSLTKSNSRQNLLNNCKNLLSHLKNDLL